MMKERITELEAYLASANGEDPETRNAFTSISTI